MIYLLEFLPNIDQAVFPGQERGRCYLEVSDILLKNISKEGARKGIAVDGEAELGLLMVELKTFMK